MSLSSFSARIEDGLIAALATPPGQSALAVIRTSGPGCIDIMTKAFSRPRALMECSGNAMVYGSLVWPADSAHSNDIVLSLPGGGKQPVDEVMLGVFRSPRSYTGEDMVEIYCHGSLPGIERIFGLLFFLGFRQAIGGEFTMRAFLNGKMDLTRAEAVQEIVTARSKSAQALALHRLGGAVETKIEAIKKDLVALMAMVSIQLDYPEDEIDEIVLPSGDIKAAIAEITALEATYRAGSLYRHGVRLAIAGRTNAGKSSLFNALVREERAIVSDIHGTTRDYLEAPFSIRGIPVRLFDTAGLRAVDEMVEKEGIRRSGLVIESSALVFYLVDGTESGDGAQSDGVFTDDVENIRSIAEQGLSVILVWNKTDVPGCRPFPATLGLQTSAGFSSIPVVGVSAKTHQGIDDLLSLAAAELFRDIQNADAEVLIDSERQYSLLRRARESVERVLESVRAGVAMDLIALDLQDSIAALGEITGEVTSDDILEVMFSGFCVGK